MSIVPFLSKYWHLIAISLLVFALVVLWDLYQGQRMTSESRGSIIREKEAEIEYRKSKEGQLIADKVAAEVRAADIAEAYPKLVKDLENMSVSMRALRTSIQAEFRALNSGTSTVIRDTIFKEGKFVGVQKSVKIDDGYLRMIGVLNPSNSTEIDWNYSYQDSVTIALHVKKKWFLGKETLYSSIMLKNPNAKVTNSTTVQVSQFRDKRWVISIGGSYDPFSNTVRPSVNFGWKVWAF